MTFKHFKAIQKPFEHIVGRSLTPPSQALQHGFDLLQVGSLRPLAPRCAGGGECGRQGGAEGPLRHLADQVTPPGDGRRSRFLRAGDGQAR